MTIAIILTLVTLLGLLLLRVPVAVALGSAGVLGLLLLEGFGYTTNVMGSSPFSQVASFGLTIIPMFILMGMFAVRARVAEYVFKIANRVVGRFPGGLGIATVMASAGFSAVSGSSIGTAATMSRLSVKEMRDAGYPASVATAVVAVAGTLGSMIPPSTFLVLYAILAQQSVGQMLAAGIVPGILSAFAYAIYIAIASRNTQRREERAERLGEANSLKEAVAEVQGNLAERNNRTNTVTALKPPKKTREIDSVPIRNLPWRGLVYIAILFAIVLGGMYSGLFTSTESAAFGALAAVVILVVEQRRTGLKNIWNDIKFALRDTASTTAMVFFIVIGSGLLSAFFIAARVPDSITKFVDGLGLAPTLTMALLLLMLIPLGMVLESLSILVITVPLLYPIAAEFGMDGIWLGIIIVKLIEIGMVTPPVGINVFVVSGITGVKTETVFKGVLPFFFIDLGLTALFFLWPGLVLFLPSFVSSTS